MLISLIEFRKKFFFYKTGQRIKKVEDQLENDKVSFPNDVVKYNQFPT